MKNELNKISCELSECLDSLEKYPILASFFLGSAQSRIEILIEKLKKEDEND